MTGPTDVPRGWFSIPDDQLAKLSDAQVRLLQAARECLTTAAPSNAISQESWALLEPYFDHEPHGDQGTLWLCVPRRKRGASL